MHDTRLKPLEFETWRVLQPMAGQRLLVAVSGGRDSVALLQVLVRLRERLRLTLAVVHVHHGTSWEPKIQEARDRAAVWVEARAKDLGVEFFLERASSEETSEAEPFFSEEALRDFRHSRLMARKTAGKWDWVVFAHHREDLLETRLLRLIRGTGPSGLKAMRIRGNGGRLRPWLGTPRARIEAYVHDRGLEWLEDPTNQDLGPLRNWLRGAWLPQLEVKCPGATESLARSLVLVAEAVSDGRSAERWSRMGQTCLIDGGIERTIFTSLPLRQKRLVLALYARDLGVRDLSQSRLLEICKRLDTDQKSLTFDVGGLRWVVNAEQIRARSV
ncbi:MAG: tRNA lysidine(34) synthetase TilS [Bdellovibrionaceae bacterium]|nr:tRNA lysidine(34) synthetase TilS [Pseudobdellovibrionaceae bacterium]